MKIKALEINSPAKEFGFAAMGKPIPQDRRALAYESAREMGVASAEDRMALVNDMAERLERDDPFGAQALGLRYLDLTGVYRTMACLLAGGK